MMPKFPLKNAPLVIINLDESLFRHSSLLGRAVNWDSRVLGLAGPMQTRESESTSKDSSDSPKGLQISDLF